MIEKKQPLLEAKSMARTFIKPSAWSASVTFINHLVKDNNVLLSVLGEKGSGKTAFAQLLQSNLSPDVQSYLITATALTDDRNIMQQINSVMTTATDLSLDDMVKLINEHEKHTILIIDDAHYLSDEFIKTILQGISQEAVTCYFHVCLISDLSLIPVVNSIAQNDFPDMIHSIELGPFNESETNNYVEQNLSVISGHQPFVTEERLAQFYQLTRGHLHSINYHMNDFFSCKPHLRATNAKRYRQLGVCLGVCLSIFALTYVVPSQQMSEQTVAVALPPQSEIMLSSNIPPYHLAAKMQALEAISLRKEGLANKEEDYNKKMQSLVVVDKVVVAPKILRQPAKPTLVAQKKSAPVVKAPALKQIAKSSNLPNPKTSNRYTIQLLASSNKSQLATYAKLHHLGKGTQVYRIRRSGTDWYVLTMGQYLQKDHAKIAAKRLPNDVAQNKPWVRLISDFDQIG